MLGKCFNLSIEALEIGTKFRFKGKDRHQAERSETK